MDKQPWGNKDALEQVNWMRAYDYMRAAVQFHDLTEQTILELHRILMDGIEYGGIYRQVSVYIPDATHDFPAPETLPIIMKEFYDKLGLYQAVCGLPEGINPLLLSAWIQAEFVNIHPFRDGNGRVARLLTDYELMRYGYGMGKVLIGSADRSQYYRLLDDYYSSRDVQPFAKFLIRHIRTPITEAGLGHQNYMDLRHRKTSEAKRRKFQQNDPEI